jgi:biotin operon repressor
MKGTRSRGKVDLFAEKYGEAEAEENKGFLSGLKASKVLGICNDTVQKYMAEMKNDGTINEEHIKVNIAGRTVYSPEAIELLKTRLLEKHKPKFVFDKKENQNEANA